MEEIGTLTSVRSRFDEKRKRVEASFPQKEEEGIRNVKGHFDVFLVKKTD